MQVGRHASPLSRASPAVVGSPRVIAHRGASSIAPENTLLAFRLAAEAGADMIETDVHLTRDGALVLIHDDDLARTTDCIGLVSGMSWSELDACDAGYWFTPNGSMRHPYRGLKIGIPRLTELFTLIDAIDPEILVQLEIKVGEGVQERSMQRPAERLIRTLDETGWMQRTIVSSFDKGVIDAVKSADPHTRTAYITGAGTDLHAAIAYAAARRHESIHPDHRSLGPETSGLRSVEAAHSAGIAVHAWTVNEPGRMLELARMGVDGITTDDPERLRRVLDSMPETVG